MNEEQIDKLTRTIGSFVISVLAIALPVLATCSLIFGWLEGLQMVLCLFTVIEFFTIWEFVSQ